MGTGRLPAGRMLHNRYRLLEKVGQGGMGAVYVAQDTQLGDRLVAVKEMSMSRLASQEVPPAIEQFKREAHLLASLHHMNLPVIYDHFGEESRWYLVMSFVQGGTLQTYLDTAPSKRLPVNEVIRIGIDLCNVLDYLHTHQPQIIFRDLKPLNIMITPQGQIYLIDFGIARHFKQDQSKDTAYYYRSQSRQQAFSFPGIATARPDHPATAGKFDRANARNERTAAPARHGSGASRT